LREAALVLITNVSHKFIRDIKSSGEYASPKVKASCRERAKLICFNEINVRILFPTIKRCAALSEHFSIKRSVIKFLIKFLRLVGTGDIAPLQKIFRRSSNPAGFEKDAIHYANKCRTHMIDHMDRYTNELGIRAQRGAANTARGTDRLVREEVQASALFSLFQTAYTYRLCKFVSSNLATVFRFSLAVLLLDPAFSRYRHNPCLPRQY
jgi:hypothetical protein